MADITEMLEWNAPGQFYVDFTCNDCGACREILPDLFERHIETGQYFINRQPKAIDEVALANKAIAHCPNHSIGNDGLYG